MEIRSEYLLAQLRQSSSLVISESPADGHGWIDRCADQDDGQVG